MVCFGGNVKFIEAALFKIIEAWKPYTAISMRVGKETYTNIEGVGAVPVKAAEVPAFL